MEPATYDISLLFVEDDEFNIQITSLLLEPMVSRLFIARDGVEGLELYKNCAPDIVLTDILMPNMDGLEMSRRIRLINSDCQIIALSMVDAPETLIGCINIGINQYVQKPVEQQRLQKAVGICANHIFMKRHIKQQNSRIAMLSQALEQLPTPVAIVDVNGCFRFMNSQFTRLTGFVSDTVPQGGNLFLESTVVTKSEEAAFLDAVAGSAPWQGELVSRNSEGESYRETVSITPLYDGSGKVTLVMKCTEAVEL